MTIMTLLYKIRNLCSIKHGDDFHDSYKAITESHTDKEKIIIIFSLNCNKIITYLPFLADYTTPSSLNKRII